MRSPDFIIVGAPKCGTTALYHYLSSHPDIFLSPIKEPNYFCLDAPRLRAIDDLDGYLRLFSRATPGQRCGEASTSYLFSNVAIPMILNHNPTTKIIVLLRNPLEMVVSYHSQKVYSFNENEPDFEIAWRLSEQRAEGHMVGSTCRAPQYLNYKAIGRLGAQLDKAMEVVPSRQLHTIVYDDLSSDPATVYRDTLSFLGVSVAERQDFSVVNARKAQAWPSLARFLMHPPPALRTAKTAMKRTFPASAKAIGKAIYSIGHRRQQKKLLTDQFREEMIFEFKDDINILSGLLQRDLSHWYMDRPRLGSDENIHDSSTL